MAFEGLKDLPHAVGDYTVAIKLAPDKVLPYIKRGGIFYRLGKIDHALADFDRWLELTPNDARGYVARAGLHTRRRTYDLALADLERAVRLDASNPAALNGLAWLLATCPEERFRNGKRAVMLAQRGCEKNRVWFCVSTLAAALAETRAVSGRASLSRMTSRWTEPESPPLLSFMVRLGARRRNR
jgi:tetratricopeptide (TPR) repeat protein